MTARAIARLLAVFIALALGDAARYASRSDWSAVGIDVFFATMFAILVVCFARQATAATSDQASDNHCSNVTELQFRQTLEREVA